MYKEALEDFDDAWDIMEKKLSATSMGINDANVKYVNGIMDKERTDTIKKLGLED